jgi:NAD(P)H-hydrate epimerase
MSAATIAETLGIEASARASGWSEEELVNLAGERLGRAIGRYFPHPGTAVGYLGKGHNAADTLVALRILHDEFQWRIETRLAHPPGEWDLLTRRKRDALGDRPPLEQPPAWRDLEGPLLLLDGLLGSGSKGSLRAPLVQLAEEIAWLRQHAGAHVAAIDIPSGMAPDSGRIFPGTVVADITFMIGHAKSGLLHGHAAAATGALALVPVEPLAGAGPGPMELISPQTFAGAKEPRPFDFHKGMAGRVAILAGSASYTGAAVLAASGALRGGGGLVTLFVPESIHALIAAKCPPEIIVRGVGNPREVLEHRFDALVVGCGLGRLDAATEAGLLELIGHSPAPSVVDADAIHAIARAGKLEILTDRHILTPHPGEFAKLAADLCELPREEAARRFADRNRATLLLKGCRTIVTHQGAPLWCNATGTPGMATGGQGDLLAGVIGARLAIGEKSVDAAALGAWLCGRAAEIAMTETNISEESLTPSDVLHFLGAAFRDWKGSRR